MYEPNKMAIPWLKKVPNAIPRKIFLTLDVVEKESTKTCVLSPNSDKNIIKKDNKNG